MGDMDTQLKERWTTGCPFKERWVGRRPTQGRPKPLGAKGT